MSVSPDTDTKLACRNGRDSSGTDRALPLRAPIDPSAPARRGQPERLRLGARDSDRGDGDQNLLGLALMRVRDELIADVRTRLSALAPGR